MGYITDFHSHILPGIDDGSRSVEMSEAMFAACKEQGIDIQIATPHFYASHDDPEHFLKKRDAAYEKVHHIAEEKGIQLLKGAEVAFFRGMGDSESLDKLLIGDTDLLLLEMPFRQWTDKDIREVKQIRSRGIIPVIAHIERFGEYQKDKDPYYELLDMDIPVQVNAEALLSLRTRGRAIRFFKEGTAKILASDCHNTGSRPQNLKEGRAWIEKKLGKDFLDELDGYTEKLLARRR